MTKFVLDERFVKIWNSAKSSRDCADKYGGTTRSVCAKAHQYRQKGIEMKRYGKRSKLRYK